MPLVAVTDRGSANTMAVLVACQLNDRSEVVATFIDRRTNVVSYAVGCRRVARVPAQRKRGETIVPRRFAAAALVPAR
jgi:hypothetical protein